MASRGTERPATRDTKSQPAPDGLGPPRIPWSYVFAWTGLWWLVLAVYWFVPAFRSPDGLNSTVIDLVRSGQSQLPILPLMGVGLAMLVVVIPWFRNPLAAVIAPAMSISGMARITPIVQGTVGDSPTGGYWLIIGLLLIAAFFCEAADLQVMSVLPIERFARWRLRFGGDSPRWAVSWSVAIAAAVSTAGLVFGVSAIIWHVGRYVEPCSAVLVLLAPYYSRCVLRGLDALLG